MIVVLTALEVEHEAVRAHLRDLRPHHHRAGTVFEVGHPAGRADRPVALAGIGRGAATAATATERAIAEFAPAAVLFVGVADALRPWVRLGDVVVATKVHGAGSRAWETSHGLVQLARHVSRTRAWPEPVDLVGSVHFEPIAAGGSHRDHPGADDAVAVEPEGAVDAGHLHPGTPTIAIRGIGGTGDGTGAATDAEGWPAIAAANAAAFALGLAVAVDPTGTAERRAEAVPPAVHNEAHGNAAVQAQIGVVHGGIVFNRSPDGT
ncbi:purine phosphorylase [Actinokineospora sp. PR83]|uniref:5'-methylthioadenosine/S-adenosylhomocysteine nucleosidase family protein n=1 Tax=Actinokineospora sp. PR83 TaxID=2884908 RepID=UPI001F446CEE|nr:purine phosphorylase [Actinokineospora sp. PR83]MCG8920023.1 purine phosphorylase [Actinokineospora sp. PR83]